MFSRVISTLSHPIILIYFASHELIVCALMDYFVLVADSFVDIPATSFVETTKLPNVCLMGVCVKCTCENVHVGMHMWACVCGNAHVGIHIRECACGCTHMRMCMWGMCICFLS